MVDRRRFLAGIALPALSTAAPLASAARKLWQPDELPDGTLAEGHLESIAGKVPLIKRSYRPPNYETPIDYFHSTITRNDAFFVRYHLSGIPQKIDAGAWRLKVGGDAAKRPVELDLATLKRDFPQVELVAVLQCSGNRRGMFQPHVQGVEWGIGAMGNARWKGVRLRDVLNRAGVAGNAIEVAFNGAEVPAIDTTHDFVKSLPVDKALDENTLIAFEMNGKPLPHWNGFPARLIAAGWTGTCASIAGSRSRWEASRGTAATASATCRSGAARPDRRDGEGDQQPRGDAGAEAHLQPRRLSPQRDPAHPDRGDLMKPLSLFAVPVLACAALAARADEGAFRLKDGPGVDKVRQNCVACHSLDYIKMNSRFLDHKGWEATVLKMKKALGAPVPDADVAPIADYLTRYYGKS